MSKKNATRSSGRREGPSLRSQTSVLGKSRGETTSASSDWIKLIHERDLQKQRERLDPNSLPDILERIRRLAEKASTLRSGPATEALVSLSHRVEQLVRAEVNYPNTSLHRHLARVYDAGYFQKLIRAIELSPPRFAVHRALCEVVILPDPIGAIDVVKDEFHRLPQVPPEEHIQEAIRTYFETSKAYPLLRRAAVWSLQDLLEQVAGQDNPDPVWVRKVEEAASEIDLSCGRRRETMLRRLLRTAGDEPPATLAVRINADRAAFEERRGQLTPASRPLLSATHSPRRRKIAGSRNTKT